MVEDVVRQNPDDVDPDKYTEEGELTELPEIPWREPERVYLETGLEVHVPETHLERETEMDLQDTPEDIAGREGIHERIQAELRNGDTEELSQAEEMLELPPVWNEVQDLLMDDGEVISEEFRPGKRSRDEAARGRRKRRNEDDIRADKRVHSATEPRRIHHPQGFYDEDWIEDQQAEEDYQKPDKFQKIANMVSLNGVPEDPPVQHHGGGCSKYDVYRHVRYYI